MLPVHPPRLSNAEIDEGYKEEPRDEGLLPPSHTGLQDGDQEKAFSQAPDSGEKEASSLARDPGSLVLASK